MISALPQIPLAVGVPRIVRGRAIVSLLGDPGRPHAEEVRSRRTIVETALSALTEPVDRPTLWERRAPGHPCVTG